MARGLNKAQLIGNLGADPEIRYTASGDAVASFSLATSDRWKDSNGQQQERTEWHNVVCWRKLAEIVGEHLAKGSRVYVEGMLRTRKWQGQDGGNRYTTEIHVDDLVMLGGNRATQPTTASADAPPHPSADPSADFNDDIPF